VKRMTVIFEDDALYTELKVAAARRGCHAKDIVSEAVREWLETQEDAELGADLEERRREYQREGGVPIEEVFREAGLSAPPDAVRG